MVTSRSFLRLQNRPSPKNKQTTRNANSFLKKERKKEITNDCARTHTHTHMGPKTFKNPPGKAYVYTYLKKGSTKSSYYVVEVVLISVMSPGKHKLTPLNPQ